MRGSQGCSRPVVAAAKSGAEYTSRSTPVYFPVWRTRPQEPMPEPPWLLPAGKRRGPVVVCSYQLPANDLPRPEVLSLRACSVTSPPAAADRHVVACAMRTPLTAAAQPRVGAGVLRTARQRVFWSSHHPAAMVLSRGQSQAKLRWRRGGKR